MKVTGNESCGQEAKLIEYLRTSIKIALSFGSKDSKDLLELARDGNDKIFRTKLTYLIDYKYEQVCLWLFAY